MSLRLRSNLLYQKFLNFGSPPPAAGYGGPPRRKTFFAIFILRVPPIFYSKRKRKFFCSASCSIVQAAGHNADKEKQNYFCGRKRICFASALFCAEILYPPRRRVWGGMRGGKVDGVEIINKIRYDKSTYFIYEKRN